MFGQEINRLKRSLQTTTDFASCHDMFFDLTEHPDFHRLSEPATHPTLEQIIQAVGQQLFHDSVSVRRFALQIIPEFRFFHGSFFLNEKIGNLFLFEDIDMGMMAVSISASTGETKLVRFRSRPADEIPTGFPHEPVLA